MASYKVIYTNTFEKSAHRLPQDVLTRAARIIDSLADDPLPRRAERIKKGERLYRIRIGNFRLVYRVDTKANVITLLFIDKREAAYKRI